MNRRRDPLSEDKEWELFMTLVALVILACIAEAVAVWYRP